MEKVTINKSICLSEHITLGEVTKSSHTEINNIPSHVAIENLKRVCIWLEALRARYNQRYVSSPESGEDRRGLKERLFRPPLAPPNFLRPDGSKRPEVERGGEEEPIIINSGYRSPELNKKVGGAPTSNHLTGCAVDIHVAGIEQALRYAVILMDYADETKQDYDELLIERSPQGNYWVHFAVRSKDNRRKTKFIDN